MWRIHWMKNFYVILFNYMSNLSTWQQKIVERRQKTPREQFIKEIGSWYPVVFAKKDWCISVYADSSRTGHILSATEFEEKRGNLPFLESLDGDVFENMWMLFSQVPLPNVHHFKSSENATYANIVSNSKNPYLSFNVTWDCENVLYSLSSKIHSKNILNSMMSRVHSENVYQSSCIISSSNVFFSSRIENSFNIRWSNDLIWCQECLWCSWLRNQSFCIENVSYEKLEYLEKKKLYIAKHRYDWLKEISLSETAVQSTDLENWMVSFNVHRWRNVVFWWHEDGLYDVADAFVASWWKNYAGVCSAAWDSEYVYCSALIRKWFDVYYSYFCEFCTFCFWCIWLKNKSYCIYNKQYTKEERHQKVDLIFQQMEQKWTLWSFFPGKLCPFNFNDTAAALIEDFSKEEVEAEWYLRRDEEIAVDIPEWMEVVEVQDLWTYESIVDWEWKIDPSILKKVIRDEEGNVYRVIKMEYDFLIKYGLPLPREHWLKRLKGHFRRK